MAYEVDLKAKDVVEYVEILNDLSAKDEDLNFDMWEMTLESMIATLKASDRVSSTLRATTIKVVLVTS